MATKFADLPEDVQDEITPHLPPNDSTLAAISVAIAKKRDDAKAARSSSGIETLWQECEEAYVGVDDANRQEFMGAPWSKPMSPDGPVTTGKNPTKDDKKSTVFVRITSRYVDAGSAKLGEILLPIDDKAFSFSETPVPDLIKAKDDKSQVMHDGMNNTPLMRPASPAEIAAQQTQTPGMPGATLPSAPNAAAPSAAPIAGAPGAAGPRMVPLTVGDLAEEAIETARKQAKAAEKRIYDWLIECYYPAEARKIIFDASRLGVGVIKGPYPKAYRGIALKKSTTGGPPEVVIKNSIKPAAKWIDPWNLFPDPSCGENIADGGYIFERDHMSKRQVEDLKKLPGYIAAQIDQVIEQGPPETKDDRSQIRKTAASTKGRYEVWYYYGPIKMAELDCICTSAGQRPSGDDESEKEVHVIATLIGSTVVRATINPLDSGSFPYKSVPWQRRAGSWVGIGVAEQMKVPQRITNASTRAMLNNAGISAGGQIIIDREAIEPADGVWAVTPNKIWYTTPESAVNDVRKAFTIVEIGNVTPELMSIIEYGMKLAEESTSIPLITQGQSGPTTPDTFGAAQLQNNNANQLLRSVGYAFDDYVTEPMIRDFYEWLLLDPDVPDEEKGDFTINAHGSIALVERAIQDQTIAQMGQMVANPIYGMDPKRWAKMFLKSKRIDPADIQYTPEEQARIDAQPPPKPPQVQAAEITAGVQRDALVMKQQGDQQSLQHEAQVARAAAMLKGGEIEAEQHRTLTDATVALHELQTRKEIAMLEHATRRGISLDQAHAELAKTMMTLDTQKQLNAVDNAVGLHKHRNPKPATKPMAQVPGRAPNGEAMAQT